MSLIHKDLPSSSLLIQIKHVTSQSNVLFLSTFKWVILRYTPVGCSYQTVPLIHQPHGHEKLYPQPHYHKVIPVL